MSFRFNFSSEGHELPKNEESTIQGFLDDESLRIDKHPGFKPSIPPNELILNNLSDILPPNLIVERIFFSTYEQSILYKRHLSDVKFQIAQEDELLETSENENTKILILSTDNDVVQGVYEGGLKTWEGAFDLLEFLAKNTNNFEFEGKKILELGCGSSLPGIYILTTKSPLRVDFQDYNEQVIKLVTIPNILLNTLLCPNNEQEFSNGTAEIYVSEDANLLDQLKKSRFFIGDWSGLTDIMNLESEQEKYDLILTSETIYNADSIPKLYDVIKHSLRRPSGIALRKNRLIAAKSIYFGVGGGVFPFRQFVEQDKVFEIKIVYTVEAHDTGRPDLMLIWRSVHDVERERKR
ncbi:15808_t:CDS:2, partial [Funneliformis mosseae]